MRPTTTLPVLDPAKRSRSLWWWRAAAFVLIAATVFALAVTL